MAAIQALGLSGSLPAAAVPPAQATALYPALRDLHGTIDAEPAKVACLDVGLAHLPSPDVRLALGIDRPLYFSVHSAAARLAPEGAALVHTMRYLAPGEAPDRDRLIAELEAYMDLVQPGWRGGERAPVPAGIDGPAEPGSLMI